MIFWSLNLSSFEIIFVNGAILRADILMVIAFSTPKFNSIPRLSLNILDGERGKRLSPSLESEAAPQGLAEFHVPAKEEGAQSVFRVVRPGICSSDFLRSGCL